MTNRTATITLTEDQLQVLTQALNARENQLADLYQWDGRRTALPVIAELRDLAGNALTAIFAQRRQGA